MTRRPDRQRQRVYNSEYFMNGTGGTLTIEQCQALADKVINDPVIQAEFYKTKRKGAAKIRVQAWRGRGGQASYRNGIQLGAWARQPAVVVHEVCHHLAGLEAMHDYRFANAHLFAVTRFFGEEVAAKLRNNYIANRVAYQGPEAHRDMPRPIRNTWALVPDTATIKAAAHPKPKKSPVRNGCTCARCGTIDNVESGGSYGQPLCRRCYYQWRKEVKAS